MLPSRATSQVLQATHHQGFLVRSSEPRTTIRGMLVGTARFPARCLERGLVDWGERSRAATFHDNVPELTIHEVEMALRRSWALDTCDPIDVPNWSQVRPSRGQCAATALVVRDLLGGQLLEAEVHFKDGERQGFHYWNRLVGNDVDLTSDQFTEDEIVQPPHVVEGPPAVSWIVDAQYQRLRDRVHLALDLPLPTCP